MNNLTIQIQNIANKLPALVKRLQLLGLKFNAPPNAELDLAPQGGNSSHPRLHSLLAIGISTFFGGPFAGGYVIYRNFIRLCQRRRANLALGWFCAGGLLAFYTGLHIPPDVISFMLFVGLPQLIVTLVAAQLMLGQAITAHRIAGGGMLSNWFALAAGVTANLAIKALCFAVSYLSSFVETIV